jgi:uncharacterized membrane protein YecN with MAPEG domain
MELVAIVALLALIECLFFAFRVGLQREKYGVAAPATTGDPVWERYYRVHHNTLEQLVVFLPALWLFATYVSPLIAAGLGLVFVVGRILYYNGYVADPAKRGTGFLIGYIATVLLLLGGLCGAVWSLLG